MSIETAAREAVSKSVDRSTRPCCRTRRVRSRKASTGNLLARGLVGPRIRSGGIHPVTDRLSSGETAALTVGMVLSPEATLCRSTLQKPLLPARTTPRPPSWRSFASSACFDGVGDPDLQPVRMTGYGRTNGTTR